MRKLNQTFGNVAYGAFSDSNNYATETNNFGETAFGILNKSTIDPDNFTSKDVVKSSKATLFSIGNGTDEQRRNVIEIKGNGDVYINGVAGYTGTDTDQAGNIAEEFQGVHDSLDSIHMQKDDDSDLVYTLIVDGEERGTINIPKDQFLEDVSYDDDTKELVFIFVTSDENNKEVRINIGNLVDIYSAGNGLSLADGQFAIKLDPTTESYITVGAEGLKVSGLDAKFDTLTQKDTEQDGRIQTVETDIDALQSDLSALKGDDEGSIGDQIQTAVDALKGGVSESYDTLKKIEDSITSTDDKFDEYLPLTGGTILYRDPWDSRNVSYNHINGWGIWINRDWTTNITKPYATLCSQGQGDSLDFNLILLNPKDIAQSQGIFMQTKGSYDSATSPTDLSNVCALAFGRPDMGPSYADLAITQVGIFIKDKTTSDLLHAAGGTTTLKTINNTSLLGSGNIEVPTTESMQEITGSNTYTGANYISKETNLTDAVIQLDEEIKATNDNLALEHANAEATYVKKTGDTMTGDLTVPNITANGNITSTKFIGSLQGNADTATKATQDANGANIASTYSKLVTTPFAGRGYPDAEHPTLTDWLSSQRSFMGTFKEAGPDNNWTNIISSRHKNGDDDGSTYGMYIANKLLGDGIGTLRWDQQVAGTWQGEKVILDSSNYTNYVDLTNYLTSEKADGRYARFTSMSVEAGSTWEDTLVNAYIAAYRDTVSDSSTNGPYSILGGNQATVIQVNPSAGAYSAQLAIGFEKPQLAFRKLGTGTSWGAWQKVLTWDNIDDKPTIEEITTQVTAKLVDGAPETLDTLNELAAALGDDPNFATTVTNQIAQKADKTIATTSANGLMSAADKAKLDSVNISNYVTLWTGTQTEYDGVTSKDANTLYFITEG